MGACVCLLSKCLKKRESRVGGRRGEKKRERERERGGGQKARGPMSRKGVFRQQVITVQ